MRVYHLGLLSASLLLCGCASSEPPPDPPVWGRVDCQRSEGNPALEQEFNLAKQICSSSAEAAALSGTAGMRGYGLAGAINQGITAGNISRSTGNACMGEKGYMLRPRSEHIAACEAILAQQKAAEPPPVTKRPVAAKPRPVPPAAQPEVPKPTT